MGTTYYVHALGDRWVETMRRNGHTLPIGEASRHPSADEIASVLASLRGFMVEQQKEGSRWSASLRSAEPHAGKTLLVVEEAKPGRPQSMRFEGGEPEIMITVLEGLARTCGVLVLRAETSLRPVVVKAGINPVAALEVWRHPLLEERS